jgi:bifunctional DNA-binding transcriptional regulator/antitoxin component of YhaV-PrlF toxin-antitoxin module
MAQPNPKPHAEKPQTRIVRSLRGGQITIPIEFRRALNIEPDTMLRITREGEELRVAAVPETPEPTSRSYGDATWFRELYDLFAPVRQEAIDRGYTEDEINGWIDEAVAEVRAERRRQSQDG